MHCFRDIVLLGFLFWPVLTIFLLHHFLIGLLIVNFFLRCLTRGIGGSRRVGLLSLLILFRLLFRRLLVLEGAERDKIKDIPRPCADKFLTQLDTLLYQVIIIRRQSTEVFNI
jgi:hypothetical protein